MEGLYALKDRSHTLSDGRRIGYCVYGQPQGFSHTVVFMHAMPGSRLGGSLWQHHAKELRVRLICPDRTGIGMSSPPAKGIGSALDDARNCLALLQALGVAEVSILGVAEGALPALALADVLLNHNTAPKPTLHKVALVNTAVPPEIFWRHMTMKTKITTKFLRGLGHCLALLERNKAWRARRAGKPQPTLHRQAAETAIEWQWKVFLQPMSMEYLESHCEFKEQMMLDAQEPYCSPGGYNSIRSDLLRSERGWEAPLHLQRRVRETMQALEVAVWHAEHDDYNQPKVAGDLVEWLKTKDGAGKLHIVEGQTRVTMLEACGMQVLRDLVAPIDGLGALDSR